MILANPKSQILTTSPCPLMSTFAGLRSLWTTFAECKYLSLYVMMLTRRVFDTWWSEHLQVRKRCYCFWRPSASRYHRIR